MFLKSFLILIAIASTSATPNAFKTLFLEQNKLYTYVLQSNVSTGTQAPIRDSSFWTLSGRISVQVYDDFGRARFKLDDLKTSVSSKNGKSFYQSHAAVEYLKKPWEVGICFSAIHVDNEPIWVTNMKRALSFNFLLSETSENSEEPCIYGICMTRYSWIGNKTRKYNNFIDYKRNRLSAYEQRHCPNRSSESWYRPFYSGDKNYVMTSERVYELDDKRGLNSMELNSDFQYRAKDDHILTVSTKLTLKYESDKPVQSIQKLNLAETSIQYETHNYTNPSNDIRNTTQIELKNKTYKRLLKIARKGIDADNIVRNATLIHSLDFIKLLNTMSQLNYTMLAKLFEDVLGTSYELETSRNIFLEVLPYVRSDACARLIKHLITEQKAKIEDAALVSLIRKLPFNVVEYSRKLLEELEVLTKLGPDFPQEIRHAGILSFATLVSKTLEVAFDQQYLDDIYDKYLRMYNNCPQYLDRLVWLQGLTNIGKSVKYYLDEIHTDNKKDRHERLWAGLASLNIWKESTFDLTLPILMNETEHIQLRIVALHAFLSTPLAARDFLNVHHYIQSCNNDQLKRFWFTTIQSLKSNKFYNKYKSASYYVPYVSNQVSDPGSSYWGTNNYIVSQEPTLDIHSPTFQVLTVGGPWNGPPEMVVVEFATGGEQSLNAALYIIAEGVVPNVFKRLQNLNFTADTVLDILKDMKVQLLQPEKVHIDIVIKIYDKTVYATHIDQSRYDSWNAEDFKKSIEDFVRFGSHINQQLVNYPIQMVKNFPTELGTPIRLESTIVSFTSIRGNLTAPTTDDITWRNDLHIRYQGTSLASLSTDGPLQPSEHTVRIQQSMVVHLPIKFDVTFSSVAKSLELKWTNPIQNGGLALHSRTQIDTASNKGIDVHTVTTNKKKKNEHGIYFDCENPIYVFELSHLFAAKSDNFLSSLQPSQLILNSLRLITSKASGSCGIILPPKQLQSGNILKLLVKLDDLVLNDGSLYWSLMRAKLSYGLSYYRDIKNDSKENFISIEGHLNLDNDGRNGTFSTVLNVQQLNVYDPAWKNWTFCLREQHEISTSLFNIDYTATPVAYNGFVALNYSSRNDFKCFSGESAGESDRYVVDFNSHPSHNNGLLKLNLRGRFCPKNEYVQKILSEVGTYFDFVDLVTKEENGKTHVAVNGTKEAELDNNFVLSGSWTGLQALKKFGFYHECRIQGSEVQTFSGTKVKLASWYQDILLVGDCTDSARFAVTLAHNDGSLTVYAGSKYVMVDDTTNLKELKPTGNTTDFIITSQAPNELIIKSKIGVSVYHRHRNLTVVLVPHGYMGTVCGACTGAMYGARVF